MKTYEKYRKIPLGHKELTNYQHISFYYAVCPMSHSQAPNLYLIFHPPWFANDVPTSEQLRIICMHLPHLRYIPTTQTLHLFDQMGAKGVGGGPTHNNPHDPLNLS